MTTRRIIEKILYKYFNIFFNIISQIFYNLPNYLESSKPINKHYSVAKILGRAIHPTPLNDLAKPEKLTTQLTDSSV